MLAYNSLIQFSINYMFKYTNHIRGLRSQNHTILNHLVLINYFSYQIVLHFYRLIFSIVISI